MTPVSPFSFMLQTPSSEPASLCLSRSPKAGRERNRKKSSWSNKTWPSLHLQKGWYPPWSKTERDWSRGTPLSICDGSPPSLPKELLKQIFVHVTTTNDNDND
ncbi:hypothetical protein JRQ81_001137, partial [Phrynocephalus forsythii]